MTDFFREVDEELRQDQFRRFLSRYWGLLIAAAVLILAGVGGFRAYDYITTQNAQDSGGKYLDALRAERDGKTDDAIKAFQDLATQGAAGYKLLARMSLAAATGKTNPAEGAKQFDAIAADTSLDPALQNLARLRAGLLLVDTLSYDDLKQRLAPLADANNGLRNSARELLAVVALKANQSDEAGKWLDAIETDPTVSPSLRQRVDAMLSLVRAGSGDAQVANPTPAAANPNASAIPGLTLPNLPTEATPLTPPPAEQAPNATTESAPAPAMSSSAPPPNAVPAAPASSEPAPAATPSPASPAANETAPAGQPAAATNPPAAPGAGPAPSAAPGGSATPGNAPAVPQAATPAPSDASPPASDTTPNAAPPK